MQIGRVQGLRRAPRTGHQHAHFGKGGARFITKLLQGAFHIAQVSAAMARFVAGQGFVDGLNDGFAVPLGRAAVPVVEADFAAKMHHQSFQRRGRVKLKPHGVKLFFGGHQLRLEAAQVFHQHQRMFLFFEEPHAHEGAEVTVVAVVAQKHLGRRQRRPLSDGVHLDRQRLLIGQQAGVKTVPRDVFVHAPAHGFQLFEEFGVKHGECLSIANLF